MSFHSTCYYIWKEEDEGRDAPPGSMVSVSSFINADLFFDCLNHLQYHAKQNQDQSVLLILDNHVLYYTLKAVIDVSMEFRRGFTPAKKKNGSVIIREEL